MTSPRGTNITKSFVFLSVFPGKGHTLELIIIYCRHLMFTDSSLVFTLVYWVAAYSLLFRLRINYQNVYYS